MPLSNFKAYNLAVQFYRETRSLRGPKYLHEQLGRAASSVVLNLAEGSAKPTARDRKRFYFIALGSQRECAAILDLLEASENFRSRCRELGACVYALCKSSRA